MHILMQKYSYFLLYFLYKKHICSVESLVIYTLYKMEMHDFFFFFKVSIAGDHDGNSQSPV